MHTDATRICILQKCGKNAVVHLRDMKRDMVVNEIVLTKNKFSSFTPESIGRISLSIAYTMNVFFQNRLIAWE